MKVKFHRTVQNTTYYTYRKLNTSRYTLSSRDPCWRQKIKVATRDVIAVRRLICAMSYQIYRFFGRKGEIAPRENPPNDDFFVFSYGDLSPRYTKVRDILSVAFSATVCRIFAHRGERSPCENPTKHLLAGFRVATFRVFAPKTRLYDMA